MNRPSTAPLAGLVTLCALCTALLLAVYPTPTAHAATCPNEAIRAEQGAAALALADCRAYELVSPGSIASLGEKSVIENGGGKSSPDGNALSYFSRYPAEGSDTSSETWLSRRTATGWSLSNVDPQMTPSPTEKACSPGVGLSEGLDAIVLSAGGNLQTAQEVGTGECGVPEEELVPGEPRGYANLYVRRGSGPYELVNPAPVGVSPENATFQGASADLGHVVFSERAELALDSNAESDLFEWSEGAVREIGILPDGTHVSAELSAGSPNWAETLTGFRAYGLAPISHAVSADGEMVYFESNGSLYLRKNAGQAPAFDANCLTTAEPNLACTVQVDRSFGASPPGPGGGVFQFAARDGGRVFFTSDHALTASSTAQAGKPDLYEYNVNKAGAKALTDLTAVGQGEPANVRGFSGGSDDGSHLYFVARGVLTGPQENSEGEVALAREPNLYLVNNGKLTYVATLSTWETAPPGGEGGGPDRCNWWEAISLGGTGCMQATWSPSGNYLLFSSRKALTGFDNTPAEGEGCGVFGDDDCTELFLYDAETEELNCISCQPTGDRPVGDTKQIERIEFQRFGPPGVRFLQRSVINSGQVFFETLNPLSPGDVNGSQDVYEYDAGVTSLISSGTATGGSGFVDASADGRDVFFITSEGLVRADGDGTPSVYDARVDGGFTEPPLPPDPCGGERTCRAPAGPPAPATHSGTSSVSGSGNVKPKSTNCRRGSVRRGGRCVKKKRHHKRTQHHKKKPKHHKKNAKKGQQSHRQGGKR
jgi:hypothetical protein